MRLHDTLIRNEEIVIDDNDTFNSIGKDAVLEDCIIRCNVAAKNISIQGQLIRSRIVAQSELLGFSWLQAKLTECTFQGVFRENEFGTINLFDGFCEGCVFANANLDDCIFYGESAASHTFPKWPNIVVLNPRQHFDEMQEQSKKFDNDTLLDLVGSIKYFDAEMTAIAYRAESLSNRLTLSTDEIQHFFSQFRFVRM